MNKIDSTGKKVFCLVTLPEVGETKDFIAGNEYEVFKFTSKGILTADENGTLHKVTSDAGNWLQYFKGECLEQIPGYKKCEVNNDQLESEEFYNVMQAYRWSSSENQEKVCNEFENVKTWIRKNYRK